jgi:hypothetical protein
MTTSSRGILTTTECSALYGGWLREQALSRGLGFVDMYSPLNNLTLAQRKKNANWTMIADGVHPEATGQLVMALAVLDDMVERTTVGSIFVQERRGTMAATARNGTISEFNAGEGIRFTHLANASARGCCRRLSRKVLR